MAFGPTLFGVLYDAITGRREKEERQKKLDICAHVDRKILSSLSHCLPDLEMELEYDSREKPGRVQTSPGCPEIVLTIDHNSRRLISNRPDVDPYLEKLLLRTPTVNGKYCGVKSNGTIVEY